MSEQMIARLRQEKQERERLQQKMKDEAEQKTRDHLRREAEAEERRVRDRQHREGRATRDAHEQDEFDAGKTIGHLWAERAGFHELERLEKVDAAAAQPDYQYLPMNNIQVMFRRLHADYHFLAGFHQGALARWNEVKGRI